MTWSELTRSAKVIRPGLHLLLYISLALFGITADRAAADETSQARSPQFSSEVRYDFRERLEGVAPGGKRYSAPAFEREKLPQPKTVRLDGKETRVIEGTVAHLPYRFAIKLTESQNTKPGTLDVVILDSAGKALSGYPQSLENPFAKATGPANRQFKIPVSAELSKTIEKTLLAKNQRLTRVELSINYSP
jgi:hypothetical protein